MSEVQAKETETKIEIEEEAIDGVVIDGGEAETTGDNPEETKQPESIEIKVEGDGKPPSRRLSRFDKRIKNKNAEIDQAESRATALEEENRLLRLNAQQQANSSVLKEPDEDTFEGSDAELKAAKKAYNQQEIKRISAEQAQTIVQQTQQNMTQASQTERQDIGISEHYKRADSMKVSNYDELEGNATDILGEDFVKTLIASTDDAHRLLASMGAAPGKTTEIARMLKNNPTKAFASALRFEINPGLSAASLKNAPDPETQVDPGSGVSKSVRGPKGATYE